MLSLRSLCFAIAPMLAIGAAHAQGEEEKPPMRTRAAIGVQLVPSFPGSDKVVLRPLFDGGRARGDDPFPFEAADESFGFPLWKNDSWEIGPALGFEGERSAKSVGAPLPKVGFTVETGVLLRYKASDSVQLRTEVRKGLGGHKGWVFNLGGDYIARDRDRWLFSIGPRLTFADNRYARSYFSVDSAAASAGGLPVYEAKGGLQAAGVNLGFVRQFTPRWGVYSYVKYDRLVGDAGDSPIVRRLGSRDQFSGGLALSYTFGRGVKR